MPSEVHFDDRWAGPTGGEPGRRSPRGAVPARLPATAEGSTPPRRASGPVAPADEPRAGSGRQPDREAPAGHAGVAVAGRRTVTISGQGAEGWQSRNGTRPSQAARHRQLKRHERAGFRPDRAAMWAVVLGILMLLAAAASAHAAVATTHHAAALAVLLHR
jgi:hypothetical protein